MVVPSQSSKSLNKYTISPQWKLGRWWYTDDMPRQHLKLECTKNFTRKTRCPEQIKLHRYKPHEITTLAITPKEITSPVQIYAPTHQMHHVSCNGLCKVTQDDDIPTARPTEDNFTTIFARTSLRVCDLTKFELLSTDIKDMKLHRTFLPWVTNPARSQLVFHERRLQIPSDYCICFCNEDYVIGENLGGLNFQQYPVSRASPHVKT